MTRYLLWSAAFFGTALYATAASAVTYSLCIGEYSGAKKRSPCPHGQPFAYCHADPNVQAALLCKFHGSKGAPVVVHLRSQAGAKCGFEFYRVVCQ